jgi:ureidoacrylate peracid hydrolase
VEHLFTLEQRLEPKHAAVVVVDMQNDFCHEDGGLAKNGGNVARTQAIVPALNALIADARKAEVPVIFVRAAHNKWTDSEARRAKQFGRQHAICAEGTWGCEWYGVAPEPGDAVVTKHRFSAFINTDLELILRAQGIQTLVMTGTATNVCVESTARDGFMLDHFIVFVDDCCGTGDEAAHAATLRNMRKDVVTSDVVRDVWARVPAKELAAV